MFTAGLVEVLLSYPREVVREAMHPVIGIPGLVDRYELTLARVRRHMDGWAAARGARLAKAEQDSRRRLEKHEPTDDEKRRVGQGFAKLKIDLARVA